MQAFKTLATLALAALVLAACASDSRPPAASAVPHGASTALNCPEQDPAQPNCRVPR